MGKEDLALNNLQWLICHKTKTNYSWKNKGVYTFLKGISSKYEGLAYCDVTVQHFNNYATRTTQSKSS